MRGDSDSCLGFVGVSTGGSSIRTVFPRWADALSLPTRTLVGHDVALDADRDTYRRLVETIRDDARYLGALVTTHKVGVFDAAADLFDERDELAETFGEISCIVNRDGRLLGSAKDPVTVRLALEEFLAADHFAATGGHALILGAGGAGQALGHQLASREDRPAAIVCTALSSGPLDRARALHERAGLPDGLFRYALTPDRGRTDALVAALPPGSLVVNATGMGKDRPGSPVSTGVPFPERGVAWDFNYRGPLDFLRHAEAQRDSRGLQVEDGWRYFVHGWSQAVAEVFDISMPPSRVDELGRIAASVR